MIEQLEGYPDNVVAVECSGHVTSDDYDAVLVPTVDAAFESHEKLRLYYLIGPDFQGIDAGAVWKDFRVGVGHLTRWDRIAIVTDVDWIAHTMQFFGFLMPGDVRVFPVAEREAARDWIVAS